MAELAALRIVDLRTLVEHTYALAPLPNVMPSFTLGNDPSCDVILPGAFGTTLFYGEGPHFFVRRPSDKDRFRVEDEPFVLGAYQLQFIEHLTTPVGVPPVEHDVGFGAARGFGKVIGLPVTAEASALHMRALFDRLRATPKITQLDASTRVSIEDRLREHVVRLGRATAPRPSLAPGYIRYARTIDDARARSNEAWQFAAIAPIVQSAYAYVHRVAAWDGAHPDGDRDRANTLSRGLQHQGWHRDQAHAIGQIAVRQMLATNPDPWEPLIELALQGITAHALPDAGFVVVIPTLVDDPPVDDAELLTRDPAVLADLLEQRGELMHAARVRANQQPTERIWLDVVQHLFPASGLVLDEPSRAKKVPVHLATTVPDAALEIAGTLVPLGSATTLLDNRDGTIVISEMRCQVTLVYDAPILYARGIGPYDRLTLELNGTTVHPYGDVPLFDGDVISIDGATATVRISDVAASDRA